MPKIEYRSPIYNILDVAVIYSLVDAIKGMLKYEVPHRKEFGPN